MMAHLKVIGTFVAVGALVALGAYQPTAVAAVMGGLAAASGGTLMYLLLLDVFR